VQEVLDGASFDLFVQFYYGGRVQVFLSVLIET
jgi:hypothetical protein